MSLSIEGTAGVNANDVVYKSSQSMEEYPEHIIQCTAGTLNVLVTLDGTNYVAVAVDIMTAAPVTQSMTVGAGAVGRLRMRVKGIQLTQNGATASDGRILHSSGS